MTELRIVPLSLPGSPVGPDNPLPFFSDRESSPPVKNFHFTEEKKRHLGYQSGFRVLPYRMQDGYDRKRGIVEFRSVVLENEFLKATFLPEVGGRLYSLIWKPEDRELLQANPVFQPANLAIRNAWFSGGVEWNLGQLGHAFTTCSPVHTARIQGTQGEPALRIFEFERCRELFWQVDFHLPPGSPFLLVYVRVVNPRDRDSNLYWWANIAVDEAPDVRVLAPAKTAIYIGMGDERGGLGLGEMPNLPSLPGKDASYSLNWPFSSDFFLQCDDTDQPWEAALDGEGKGLIETSTPPLRYRKLFMWGNHPGGRHWQEFLSQKGEAYIEIQAGVAPTQIHGQPFPARAEWDWLQAFSFMEADPALVHHPDWDTAWRSVDALLRARLNPAQLAELREACRRTAQLEPQEFLVTGSGWGALEVAHSGSAPSGFRFPPAGPEQEKWLHLLQHGRLPAQDPTDLPGEWMVQQEWEQLLTQSAEKNWLSWLHLGVMQMERGEEAEAEASWKRSIALAPSAWAWRNLAVLSLRRKEVGLALEQYAQAWQLAAQAGNIPAGLAVEYMRILHANQHDQTAWEVFESLPEPVRSADRIQMLRGEVALVLNDLDTVEEVLRSEYAEVREGENTLSDLWFELHTRREAARTGREIDDELRSEVRKRFPPPHHIDFRMSVEK